MGKPIIITDRKYRKLKVVGKVGVVEILEYGTCVNIQYDEIDALIVALMEIKRRKDEN